MLRTAIFAIVTASILWAPPGHARWEVSEESPPGVAAEVSVAVVRNDSGHSLRIYRDDDGRIRGVFGIRDGFEALAADGCPSFQVDARSPQALKNGSGECEIDPKHARFTLGRLDDRYVHSDALLELMNGTRLRLRYRMIGLGYRETTFSLRRSKQALGRAIGSGVVVLNTGE